MVGGRWAHLRDLLKLAVGLAAFLCCLHCHFIVVHKSFVHTELTGLGYKQQKQVLNSVKTHRQREKERWWFAKITEKRRKTMKELEAGDTEGWKRLNNGNAETFISSRPLNIHQSVFTAYAFCWSELIYRIRHEIQTTELLPRALENERYGGKFKAGFITPLSDRLL